MSFHHVLYLALLAVSGAVSGCVAVLAWRNRDVAGASPLAALMGAATLWAAAKVLELSSTGLQATVLWASVQYAGIVVVPAAWLVFALQYSGRDEWLNRRSLAALAVEPAFVLLATWTNAAHGLFWSSVELASLGAFTSLSTTYGPVFWVHAVYSYVLLATGTWMIVKVILVSEHLYRSQAIGLLAAVSVPWLGNGVYLAGFVPRGMDPTIVAFTASGLLFLWAITRYRLLALIPAAREVARAELIERMNDAVVVVDERGLVVDGNPAAQRVLDCQVPDAIGRPLESVCPPLHEAIRESTPGDETDVQTAFSTWDGDAYRSYDVRVSPLRRGRGLVSGRIVNVREVTEQRRREQRLDVMNRLIRHNVRNELNLVIGTARMLRDELPADRSRDRVETIHDAADRLLRHAEKMNEAANRSRRTESGPTDVSAEVASIIDSKREAHPDAEISIDRPDEAWTSAGPAVATAIDELVSNAIQHGNGTEPTVHVSVSAADSPGDGGSVSVRVEDAGPGIPPDEVEPILRGEETPLAHSTGVGLWIVTWIVRESGGDVAFDGTDGGTTVTVDLPGPPGDDGTD